MLLKSWPSTTRSYKGRDPLQRIRDFFRSSAQGGETSHHLLKKERS